MTNLSREQKSEIFSFHAYLFTLKNKLDFTEAEMECLVDKNDTIIFTDEDYELFSTKFHPFVSLLESLKIENNLGLIFQLNHVRFHEKISLFIDQIELIIRRFGLEKINDFFEK